MAKKRVKAVTIDGATTKAAKSKLPAELVAGAEDSSPMSLAERDRTLREISKQLASKEFAGPEEMSRFLGTLTAPNSPFWDLAVDDEDSSKDEAQELAFEAMEAPRKSKARKLALQAVALDPDCVDALVLLAGLDSKTPEEAVESLFKAVAAGERSLGPSYLEEAKGEFWGLLETRPYMRARQKLAEMLCEMERFPEAIAQYEAMLELNPNDNQGVREPLLATYIETSELDAAAKLMKRYEGDISATFAWCGVLLAYLRGDLAAAASQLKAARKGNRHVEVYLTGQRKPPSEMPYSYALGSLEEAVISLESLVPAWTAHSGALFWLIQQVVVPTLLRPGMRAFKKPRLR